MNQPDLFPAGKRKKKRAEPTNSAELAAKWMIAEAICAAVPGESDSMSSNADRARIYKYARLAYEAGARSAEDIGRAVAARRRAFPRNKITAASIGSGYGDYAAFAREQGAAPQMDREVEMAADNRQQEHNRAAYAASVVEQDRAIDEIPDVRLADVLVRASSMTYRRRPVPEDWRDKPMWRAMVTLAWREQEEDQDAET